MKQEKQRFNVSIDFDLFELLQEYSDLSNLSKSEIIEAWIREASPELEKLIKLYGAIERASDDDLEQIKGELMRLAKEKGVELDD